LKTEGSLDNDGQDGQKPVGANVVDKPSTSDGTRVLPVLESPSLSVRATTEGDDEAGNDESNNQRDWSQDPSTGGLRRDTSVNGLLLIKQRKNSDSPK